MLGSSVLIFAQPARCFDTATTCRHIAVPVALPSPPQQLPPTFQYPYYKQVLAEELDHTSATLAAMEQSHGALGKTRDEYTGQHRHLRRSKGLLGTLNWQAKSVRTLGMAGSGGGGAAAACVAAAVLGLIVAGEIGGWDGGSACYLLGCLRMRLCMHHHVHTDSPALHPLAPPPTANGRIHTCCGWA